MNDQILTRGQVLATRAINGLKECTTDEERVAVIASVYSRPLQEIVNLHSNLELIEHVLAHLTELRQAWETGAIRECDGKGGTRSNRNVECEFILRSIVTILEISKIAARADAAYLINE